MHRAFRPRVHRALISASALAFTGAAVMAGSGMAAASFPGSSNGSIAFSAICDPTNIGQAIYSINPAGSPPYSCPGQTPPNYTQSTAGSTDSMPSFDPSGATLYFASNRGGSFAIYKEAYPTTVTGPAGSQVDAAVAITTPAGGENDYAPTVSPDGSTLAFISCDSGNTCSLETQKPIVGGTPTPVTTSVHLAAPDPTSGAASRPEFDPVDPSQIIYVGTDGHIHLVSLTGAFPEKDLSALSGVGSNADEYPDWSPTGTAIVFDSNRNGGHKVFTVTVNGPSPVAAQVWASDPGTEIEPVYAPDGVGYAWTKLGTGSNLQLDEGTSVNSPATVISLTDNKTNNSEPAWQPIPLGANLPEAPLAVLLPLGAGAVLLAGGLVARRRRRTAA